MSAAFNEWWTGQQAYMNQQTGYTVAKLAWQAALDERNPAPSASTNEQSTKICPICKEQMYSDEFGNYKCCNRSCES